MYIKPACHHDIPADVRAYALASKDFPHESTADQWFSESQFESYRSLGANLVDRLGEQTDEDRPRPKPYGSGDVAKFFDDVSNRVAQAKQGPKSPSKAPNASRSSESPEVAA